jgi:lysophospholipase L1-like esterase
MQVIVLAVSPVRPSAVVSNVKITTFNGMLEQMAADLHVYYYDYTDILKDSDGALKKSYCSSTDGIHLTPTAYEKLISAWDAYGEELD